MEHLSDAGTSSFVHSTYIHLEKVLKEGPVVDVLLLAAALLEEDREKLIGSTQGALIPVDTRTNILFQSKFFASKTRLHCRSQTRFLSFEEEKTKHFLNIPLYLIDSVRNKI